MGEYTESIARWQAMGVETVFPFKIAEKTIVKIQPRTDSVGLMELYVVEGNAGAPDRGCIYLWRGSKNATECEETLENEIPTFDLAASVAQKGEIKVEPGIGQLTLFSFKLARGFIRVREFPC